jgi:hypothetical protein
MNHRKSLLKRFRSGWCLSILSGLRYSSALPSWVSKSLPTLAALISILILLNKSFNDIVHVSRAFGGLTKLSDSKDSGAPIKSWLKIAKAPFKILAVQRLFHSVEMTIIIVLFSAHEILITYGLYVALFVTFGHLVAILGSRKLDPR